MFNKEVKMHHMHKLSDIFVGQRKCNVKRNLVINEANSINHGTENSPRYSFPANPRYDKKS